MIPSSTPISTEPRLLQRLQRSLVALAAIAGLALACSPGSEPTGEPAPEVVLRGLDGEPVSLASLRGKWVLIDFWATWCPPCVLEIPELNAFQAAERGRGVEVVAISVDELETTELAAWVADHDIQYPVAHGDLDVASAFAAVQFPTHVLMNPQGEIVDRLPAGYHDRDELRDFLDRHR